VPDVERVETHQLAGALGSDVARAAMPQPPQRLPRALGQQAGLGRAVVLEDQQPLSAGGEAVARSNRCTVLGATRSCQRRWA